MKIQFCSKFDYYEPNNFFTFHIVKETCAMRRFKIILRGTVFVFILCNLTLMQQSCSYNEIEPPKPIAPAFCDSVDITYSGSVKAIIAAECAVSGCHDANSNNGDFTSYNKLKFFLEDGEFKTRVFSGPAFMPAAGFVNPVNKDILKCWYDKGALNN
jgi:hypothetical protein